jgi:hypothetical protein
VKEKRYGVRLVIEKGKKEFSDDPDSDPSPSGAPTHSMAA